MELTTKKIKLTNKEALEYLQILNNNLDNKEYGIKINLVIAKSVKALENAVKEYKEIRDNLIIKYGEEKDGSYFIDTQRKESLEKFNKELEKISCIEENIEIFTLKENDLQGMSAREIIDLEFLIDV